MRILTLSRDNSTVIKTINKLENAEVVTLFGPDASSFANVMTFMDKDEMMPGDFAKMVLRYLKKYDCKACLLDRGLPGIGHIKKDLNDEEYFVCFPITITEKVSAWSDGGMKPTIRVHVAGIEFDCPDGSVKNFLA